MAISWHKTICMPKIEICSKHVLNHSEIRNLNAILQIVENQPPISECVCVDVG